MVSESYWLRARVCVDIATDEDALTPIPFGQDTEARPYSSQPQASSTTAFNSPNSDEMRGLGSAAYRPATHDAQLEAALAIIADRAARVQAGGELSASPHQPTPTTALHEAHRSEKSRHRANAQAGADSQPTPNSISVAASSDFSGALTSDHSGPASAQPPSYMESTVPSPLTRP
jgi:hypothetical protein